MPIEPMTRASNQSRPPLPWNEAGGLSRRRFLRHVTGGSLALPFLASLPVRSEESGKRIVGFSNERPPVRFGCIYFSNGVEPAHWWAEGQGREMRLGPGLDLLRDYREDLVFLKGLFNEQAARHPSVHLGRVPNLLSGAWVSEEQSEIRAGRTMDQVMAATVGQMTPVPSLTLGIEPTELRLEDGLSMIYGSCISWQSDTKPTMKEIYPARVFDLLVGQGGERRLDRSILESVADEAKSLRRKLNADDRSKLNDYLDSIRDIETRIERAARVPSNQGWQPSLKEPDLPRPADALPSEIPSHMKLMMDLIVLAFQMDKTRIATCMLNNDLSQMNFGFLEGVKGSLHLDLTHNGRDPELERMYLETNRFHVSQFLYLLERMKAIDEGGTTLLDNCLLMLCSNLFDGDKHQADEMPIVLAGKGGGSLKTGRVMNYREKGDENRRACSLYLSLMDKMGVSVNRFGDARSRLVGV